MATKRVFRLSTKEAEVLMQVCNRIGGCPFNSSRAVTDALNVRLDKTFTRARPKDGDVSGGIYFSDSKGF